MKPGQSRFYLGYQKHTFRLWLPRYEAGVLLVPLVSWATPANLAEGRLLLPSMRYCQQRWRWHPDIVVGDLWGTSRRPPRRAFGNAGKRRSSRV